MSEIKCSRCAKVITEKAKICVPCFVELSTQTPLEAAAPVQNDSLQKILKIADKALTQDEIKRGIAINDIANIAAAAIAKAKKE